MQKPTHDGDTEATKGIYALLSLVFIALQRVGYTIKSILRHTQKVSWDIFS